MELSNQLVCECNEQRYASTATLKAYRRANIHITWDLTKQVKDLEIRSTRLDNENGHLKRLNVLLMERISTLEG
jgi:hypothetical protein